MRPAALKTLIALPLLLAAACSPAGRSAIDGGAQVQSQAPNNVKVVAGPAPIDTSAGTIVIRDGQNSDGVLKVALLLPYSGKNAPIGGAMKNAAQLAVFDANATGFQLLPRDSGDTAESAAQAASTAVTEGADLIIGPLLSIQARPVAQAVQTSGVPVITVSNDRRLAADGVLVMGLIPADQVRRVLSYAASHGKRTVSVVAPPGPYGDTVLSAVEEIAPQLGMGIAATTRATDPAGLVAFQAAGGLAADSILVGLDANQLKTTVASMTRLGLVATPGKILGTGQLEGSAADPALAGVWYATTPSSQRQALEQRYRQTYPNDVKWHRLATLAYDATLLAAALGRQPTPAGQSPFTRAALTNPAGFSGADGIFRFRADGESERGLAVFEIGAAGTQQIDPAPSSFPTRPGM